MMDTDTIRNCALQDRDNGSADDRHDHDSGTVTGKRPKFSHSQREDAREHDGIKKANSDDTPHGRMARRQHRNCDQGSGAHRANTEQSPGAHLLQESGTNETSDHGAAPVKSHKTGRTFLRNSANLTLTEVVNPEPPHGKLTPESNTHHNGPTG